tara:strand:+ start:2000 stop:2173 length:174 start_codon:yes stop_codon:yes gene_type:complete
MAWILKEEHKNSNATGIYKPLDELSQEEILALIENVRNEFFTENSEVEDNSDDDLDD